MNTASRWEFADRVLVRMAGFPVSWLLRLQSPAAVASARRVVALERDLRERRREILDRLSAFRRGADTGPRAGTGPRADARAVRAAGRAQRLVRRLRPVPLEGLPARWAAGLLEWNDVARERESAIAVGAAAWAGEIARAEEALRGITAAPEFQEAVFLNSPAALARIRGYAAGDRSAKVRRLAVRYLQRFCVKTETGGFYGPINHGRLDSGRSEPVAMVPRGSGYSARRSTLLSYWAAERIAAAFARDDRLIGLLRLYRNARDDDFDGAASEPLLAFATGEHTLEEVADALRLPLEDVHAAAANAEARGRLRVGLRVPACCGDPLAALRGLVAGSRAAARIDLSGALDEIAAVLRDFEAAGLAGRERLLERGEGLLARLTGCDIRRGNGEFYADRFWYTEEAVGNLGPVVFGNPVTRTIRALGLALDILASHAVTERRAHHETLGGLLAARGGHVPARHLAGLPPPAPLPAAEAWGKLLSSADARASVPLRLSPDDLPGLGLVRDDLDDWPVFCAPDVMLAGDPARLAGGDWQIVLAEVHHICPLTQLPFAAFEPEPEAVRARLWEDITRMAAPARPLLQGVSRTNKTRDYTPIGHDVLWLDWQGHEPGSRGVRVGDCTVGPGPAGRPALRDADGVPLALFPEYDDTRPDIGMLRSVALPQMDKRPVAVSEVTPRITVGRVVYQRRRWDLAGADLPPRGEPAGSFREYLAVWRWKSRWDMPDQVFVRLPGEEKPIFVDFAGPLSVDAFLRASATSGRVGVEEMLPGFDQLWLQVDGDRYCSELRLTGFRR